jgi:hypothetical protein
VGAAAARAQAPEEFVLAPTLRERGEVALAILGALLAL